MKVAGRKNDGAWYRANKLIKSLTTSEKNSLKTVISGLGATSGLLNAIQNFYDAAGLSSDPNRPADVDALASTYSTSGIPRQAWFGQLSYDIYDRTGTSPAYVYTPQHRDDVFLFGKQIRKAMKEFAFARRQALDLTNIIAAGAGNPGGIADATSGN